MASVYSQTNVEAKDSEQPEHQQSRAMVGRRAGRQGTDDMANRTPSGNEKEMSVGPFVLEVDNKSSTYVIRTQSCSCNVA